MNLTHCFSVVTLLTRVTLSISLIFFGGGSQEAMASPAGDSSEAKDSHGVLTLFKQAKGMSFELSVPVLQMNQVYDVPANASASAWASRVLGILNQPESMWRLSGGGCVSVDYEVQAPLLARIVRSTNGWEDPINESGLEGSEQLRARYFYQCRDVMNIENVEALFFQFFTGVSALDVRIKTGGPEIKSHITSQAPKVMNPFQ